MKLPFTRKTISAEHRDTSTWRLVDSELLLDQSLALRFATLQRAVEAYLVGQETVKDIAGRNGLHAKQILRAVNRCLLRAPDGRINGWAGLISYWHVVPFHRRKALPLHLLAGNGFAGTFQLLLSNYPALQTKLDAQVFKLKIARTAFEFNQQIVNIHQEFLCWCTDEGIKAGQYPFNTNSKASRSVARYVVALKNERAAKGLRAENRKDARHRLGVGREVSANLFAHAPFDVVQMDGHRLHMIGTVRVPTQTGFTYVPIQRMSLVLLAEVFSQAILGYALVVRREPKATDVVAAVNSAISVWTPREIAIPGMTYPTGGGLPSGLIPELAGVGWTILQVDNALVHYADRLVEQVRRRIGFALNWGPFGTWERRPIVESIFKRLEQRGFQRIASSTGSGPEDETVVNPNAEAVKHAIENRELVDLVELVIAAHNAKKTAALGAKSPLMVLRDFAAMQDSLFLARKLPPATGATSDLTKVVEYHRVRGSRTQGRRPYIQIESVHYTNAVLADSFALIGQMICVHVNEGDMRSHRAFFMDGQELGFLVAKGRWNRTPWSREEGRLVRALMRDGELDLSAGDDPVYAFHCHLARKSQEDARKQKDKRPKTSVATTMIARIQSEGRGTDAFDTVQPVSSTPAQPDFAALPLGRFVKLIAPQQGGSGETK